MSWKHEVRVQLAAVLADRPVAALPVDETDDDRQALLAHVMALGAKLFRFARTELGQAGIPTTYEYTRGKLRLSIDGSSPERFVEAEPMKNGLAIKVQREFGVVEILQVKNGVVVDSKEKCVGAIDGYFTCLVVELVRTASGVA